MKEGVGDIFQKETKYHRGQLPPGGLDWGSKPDTYKRYSSIPRVTLPPPSFDQETAYCAHVVFVWTAVFERSKWKYKQRAYRYIYLDAGHIAQNVALSAVALGLGSCQIGALYDDEANALLGVDGVHESTIYMTAVGREG